MPGRTVYALPHGLGFKVGGIVNRQSVDEQRVSLDRHCVENCSDRIVDLGARSDLVNCRAILSLDRRP